jgi:uncharacterized protein
LPNERLVRGVHEHERVVRSLHSGWEFEYWRLAHLTVDVVEGRGGSGFSVEALEGVRFIIRSRLFSDHEWRALEGR